MQNIISKIHSTAKEKGFWDDYLDDIEDIDASIVHFKTILLASKGNDGTAEMLEKSIADLVARRARVEFNFFAKQMTMLHSEISELMEALRKNKGKIEVEAESADIFIRLVDLYEGLRDAGYAELSLIDAVKHKAGHNLSRDRLHGVLG
jgi:NTP pyrophosphatase (non-canonical NTP hydrolase)